jgi:hypothetical protein
MVFGLRREIKIPNTTTKYLIIQKAFGVLPACIGVVPKDVLNYVIVKTSDDKNYEFIDNPGESDGFFSYIGCENFLRAYILVNHNKGLPHRFYMNEFTNSSNGALIDKDGNEVWF